MTEAIPISLSMTGDQHAALRRHLFPGDGKEAVAIALCGRRAGDRRHRLLIRKIFEIPYSACSERTDMRVTWPTKLIEELLEEAEADALSVVKIHSHPGGYGTFSAIDDEGDQRLLPMIAGCVEHEVPHGSAVMLPDGQMFGRIVSRDGSFTPMVAINVVGDDLHFWYADAGSAQTPDFTASHAQAFDDGTIDRLQRLSVAVIGCSGTGSPVIEQLMRLGVGELVNVDDDHVEERNVNRILNSTMQDVAEKRPKVEVMERAIEQTGLGTRVISYAKNLWDPEVIRAVAQCDIVIGCMDSVDGRYLLNVLATFYTQAYFDIGVRLDAVRDGKDKGRIREICGTIHYLQPGRSSLISRGLIDMKAVAAAGLRRNDPDAHRRQLEDGYIAGAAEHRPAVISVNMFAASLAVNELLARLHPYREEPNRACASVVFSLASMELMPEEEEEGMCGMLAGSVGKGDVRPLLGQMDLAEKKA